MADNTKNHLTRMLLSKSRRAQYAKAFVVLAACVAIAVAVILHQNGVAMVHEEQVLTCPVEERIQDALAQGETPPLVAHTHDDSCYDENGNLVCGLPERDLHIHDESCYTEVTELTCGLEESDDHQHDDGCYTTTYELTCGKEEVTEEHTHGQGCFTTVTVDDGEPEETDVTEQNANDSDEPQTVFVQQDVADDDGHDNSGQTIYSNSHEQSNPQDEDETSGDDSSTSGKIVASDDPHKEEKVIRMPAQEFEDSIVDGDGNVVLLVSVSAPEGAFPENTTMRISSVNPDEVKGAVDDAIAQKEENSKVLDLEAVDITFFNEDGEEIEPAKKIEVRFTSNLIAQNQSSYVVHMDSQGNGSVVHTLTPDQLAERNQSAGDDELYINTKEFSPYVIVSVSLQCTLTVSDGSNYTITADCPAEACIPQNAELKVSEIMEGTEEYEAYYKKVNKNIQDSLTFARFFEISIVADGEEIQPSAPVSIRAELINNEEKGTTEEAVAVHFVSSSTMEIIDAELENQTVSFDAEGFSVYGVVGTQSIQTDVLMDDGKMYTVTVSYDEKAKVPAGTTLKVTPYEKDSEKYKAALNALKSEAKEKGEEVDTDSLGFALLDMSMVDKNGNEVEPEDSVTIDMKIKELPDVEDLESVKKTLKIQHYVEGEDGVVVQNVFDGSAKGAYKESSDSKTIEAEFVAESFSQFGLTWNNGRAQIHYVDESGNELHPENYSAKFPKDYNTLNYSPVFLIYDIDGYEYKETYVNTNTNNNKIAPILLYENNAWKSVAAGSQASYTNKQTLPNNANIYVVYKQKPATPEPDLSQSTHTTTAEDWQLDTGEEAAYPQLTKTSKNNKNSKGNLDGTNTITLSIKGAEKEVSDLAKANVIVIFDTSSSMTNENNNINWYNPTTKRTESKTRLFVAQEATRNMIDALMGNNSSNNNVEVKMALITFDTYAQIRQEFTNDADTIKNTVNQISANGPIRTNKGTNWEDALQLANEMTSDAPTYVVFVTDGEPTLRVSRGNYTDQELNEHDMCNYELSYNGHSGLKEYWPYRAYSVFGAIDSGANANPNNEWLRNVDAAVPRVQEIVSKKKSFYAIGIGDTSDKYKLGDLFSRAGVSADNLKLAASSTEIKNAFDAITANIQKTIFGFANVEITDGITDLTNTDAKRAVTNLQDIDPDSFTYYRYGGSYGTYDATKPWTTREADHCGAATYDKDSGCVVWNMGSEFQLEEGVTYEVQFRAWPKQEAFDIIADINNGLIDYHDLEDEVKEQIDYDASTHKATLKTNTNTLELTYSKSQRIGTSVSVLSGATPETVKYLNSNKIIFTEKEDMPLQSMTINVEKKFEDTLTGGEDQNNLVKLKVMQRVANTESTNGSATGANGQGSGSNASSSNTGSNNPGEGSSGNGNTSAASQNSFTPYEVDEDDGPIIKLGPEKTESGEIINHEWIRTNIFVSPGLMIKDKNNPNQFEILEHGYEYTVIEDGIDYHYELVDASIVNPMMKDGEEDQGGNGAYTITATNRVKAGIDVEKIVYDYDGVTEVFPDKVFTITGKILDKDGNPYTWQEDASENDTGAYHKFSPVPDGTPIEHDDSGDYIVEANNEHTKVYTFDGHEGYYTRTLYKQHFASTDNITLSLKPHEFVRFINVPEGCTFIFTETEDAEFGCNSIDVSTMMKKENGLEAIRDTLWRVNKPTASYDFGNNNSTGILGDRQYAVTFKNKRKTELPDIELEKSNPENEKLNGVKFKLYKDSDKEVEITKDKYGHTLNLTTGNKEGTAANESDGWISLGSLETGTYYLYEDEGIEGYIQETNPIIIKVEFDSATTSYTVSAKLKNKEIASKAGNVYTIQLTNKHAFQYVEFRKVGEASDDGLKGAKFTLTVGSTPYSLESNQNGYMFYENENQEEEYRIKLPVTNSDGFYQLVETDAPDGYLMLTKPVKIYVNDNTVNAESPYTVTDETDDNGDKIYTITIPNSMGAELPATGGSGTTLFYAIGMWMVLAAGALYGLSWRRNTMIMK